MKEYFKVYINKLLTYLPVAIFVFTLVFFINISQTITDFKAEYGVEAIDQLVSVYKFYFIRTTILALLIPLYDVVLLNEKFSYRKATLLHFTLIIVSVGILYFRPEAPFQATLIILGMCLAIYIIIRIIVHFREKQFLANANEIFKQNKE